MLSLDWSIIWNIVNILILFLVLKHFLFGPITKMMESRTAEIEGNLKDAEDRKAQAQEKCARYDARLADAETQAAQIVTEARARGQKEYDGILKTAGADAQKAVEQARGQMELEREQMLRDTQAGMADIVLLAAAKVSEKELDEKTDRVFLDSFLQELSEKDS